MITVHETYVMHKMHMNQRIPHVRYIVTVYNRKPTRELAALTCHATLLEWLPTLEEDWITNSEVSVGITPTKETSRFTESHKPGFRRVLCIRASGPSDVDSGLR